MSGVRLVMFIFTVVHWRLVDGCVLVEGASTVGTIVALKHSAIGLEQ